MSPPDRAVTNTSDIGCPYRASTSEVRQVTNTTPRVQGWSCLECGTDWWVGVVNPHRWYLNYLAGSVQIAVARSMLRQVIDLADEAPTLPDDHLRVRLAALAAKVAQ